MPRPQNYTIDWVLSSSILYLRLAIEISLICALLVLRRLMTSQFEFPDIYNLCIWFNRLDNSKLLVSLGKLPQCMSSRGWSFYDYYMLLSLLSDWPNYPENHRSSIVRGAPVKVDYFFRWCFVKVSLFGIVYVRRSIRITQNTTAPLFS